MDVRCSDVVLSTAGHDKGGLFFVLRVEGDYLLLADGRSRTLEKPKRKKRTHVLPVTRPDTDVAKALRAGGVVRNSELRKELAILRQSV